MKIYYAAAEDNPLDNGNSSQVIDGADHSTIEDSNGRARRQTYLGQKARRGVVGTTAGALVTEYAFDAYEEIQELKKWGIQ